MSQFKKSTKIAMTVTFTLVILGSLFVYRSILFNNASILADTAPIVTYPPVPDNPPADDSTAVAQQSQQPSDSTSTTTSTSPTNSTTAQSTQKQVAASGVSSASEGSASFIMAQSVKSGISFPVIIIIILIISGLLIFRLLRRSKNEQTDLGNDRKKAIKTAVKALVILIVVSGAVYLVSSYQSLGTLVKLKFDPKVFADDNKSATASKLQALPKNTTKIDATLSSSLKVFQNNHLYYPKFGIDAPVSWNVPEKMIDELLKNGLVQLGSTATPDTGGDVLIAGHSSYYSWVKSGFKDVFAPLVDSANGDNILVQKSNVLYLYKVSNIQQVKTSDKITINIGNQYPKTLDLITCVPIGTNLRRLIIKADFVRQVRL